MSNTNNQATNVTARINVMEPVPNVDINYGPYENIQSAENILTEHGMWNNGAIGLTVGIWADNTHKEVIEYTLCKNLTELYLKLKQSDLPDMSSVVYFADVE